MVFLLLVVCRSCGARRCPRNLAAIPPPPKSTAALPPFARRSNCSTRRLCSRALWTRVFARSRARGKWRCVRIGTSCSRLCPAGAWTRTSSAPRGPGRRRRSPDRGERTSWRIIIRRDLPVVFNLLMPNCGTAKKGKAWPNTETQTFMSTLQNSCTLRSACDPRFELKWLKDAHASYE